MKVAILTTSAYGTTGHHLPLLQACKDIEITMVIVSENQVPDKKKQRRRRIKKIMGIGIGGAINGIRMRKWYNEDINQYTTITDAQQYCLQHNIPYRTVPHTNSKETQQALTQSGAEVALSLGNGYISSKVFGIPEYGMLNVHHELLPQYQNAQSIIWELYNGSRETGYTIHKIDKHIDTGAILLQEKLPIEFRDTLADTVSWNYARLFDASAQGLVKLFGNFHQYFADAIPQGKGNSYTTPSLVQFLKIKRQFERLRSGK